MTAHITISRQQFRSVPDGRIKPILSSLYPLFETYGALVVALMAPRPKAGVTAVIREIALAAAESQRFRVSIVRIHRPDSETRFALSQEFQDGREMRWVKEFRDIEYIPVYYHRNDPAFQQNLQALFQSLRKSPALVFVDYPPVLEFPEIASTASMADTALLVVDPTQLRMSEAISCQQVLQNNDVAVLGLVLNKTALAQPVAPRTKSAGRSL